MIGSFFATLLIECALSGADNSISRRRGGEPAPESRANIMRTGAGEAHAAA